MDPTSDISSTDFATITKNLQNLLLTKDKSRPTKSIRNDDAEPNPVPQIEKKEYSNDEVNYANYWRSGIYPHQHNRSSSISEEEYPSSEDSIISPTQVVKQILETKEFYITVRQVHGNLGKIQELHNHFAQFEEKLAGDAANLFKVIVDTFRKSLKDSFFVTAFSTDQSSAIPWMNKGESPYSKGLFSENEHLLQIDQILGNNTNELPQIPVFDILLIAFKRALTTEMPKFLSNSKPAPEPSKESLISKGLRALPEAHLFKVLDLLYCDNPENLELKMIEHFQGSVPAVIPDLCCFLKSTSKEDFGKYIDLFMDVINKQLSF